MMLKQLEPEADAENEEGSPGPGRPVRGFQQWTAQKWDRVYTAACREGNMSPRITHPGLRLRAAFQLDRDNAHDLEVEFQQVTVQAEPQAQLPQLPHNVQLEILRHVLVFDKDTKIHVISRLDQFDRPQTTADIPMDEDGNPLFFHRFCIGRYGQSTSVRYAQKPAHVLAVLGVCKLWHVWGCHLFYGLNTFAFSSLGE